MPGAYGTEPSEREGPRRSSRRPPDRPGPDCRFPVTVAGGPSGPVPRARRVERPDAPRTGTQRKVGAGGFEAPPTRPAEEYGACRPYAVGAGIGLSQTVGIAMDLTVKSRYARPRTS